MANETRLFQLYDRNAQVASGPIMAAKNPAPFLRELKRLLGDPTTDVGKYPEDFELRELGSQDTETCQITGLETPQVIYSGAQWKLEQQATATSNGRGSPPTER